MELGHMCTDVTTFFHLASFKGSSCCNRLSTSFFSWLNNILLYLQIPFSLSIHLLMDICAVFISSHPLTPLPKSEVPDGTPLQKDELEKKSFVSSQWAPKQARGSQSMISNHLHQYHLGACQKCKSSIPAPDLVNQNLWGYIGIKLCFNKTSRGLRHRLE